MTNGVATGLPHSARSGFPARAKHFILSIVLIVATASVAEATSYVIDTDASWLAKNSTPGAGWNTSFAFDTGADGGWQAASNNAVPPFPCSVDGCMIWWDGQFSATEQTWFRRTFVLDGPVASAFIQGGFDDDGTIWVNGTIVYDVFDGTAGPFGPIDIAPYLVPGNNLIAVFADDNLAFGSNHQFTARLTIDTAGGATATVPTLSPTATVLMGLLLLAVGIYVLRGHIA